VTTAHRSRWLLTSILLFLAVVAAACGDDGGSAGAADDASSSTLDPNTKLEIPPGVKLTIGDQGSGIETPLRLAGQLDDLPYEVEFASFASGPLVNEAIAAGEVDLGAMGDTPALLSYASGLDTIVVAVRVTEGSGASIVAADGSGITSLEDLKGKRIAYATGTNTHGLVLRALDSVGLREDDIEQVDVPLTDLANVLASGQADAAVIYEIFRPAYFGAHPDAVTLVTSNDLVPTYSFLLAPRSSVEDPGKQAALEDFVARIARASTWVKAHPDAWIDAYYVGVQKQTPEAGRAAYEAQGPASWVEVGGQALADQQEQADLLFENHRLPKAVDLSRQFDPQYAIRFSNAITNATEATK
jgi:sulfonate transport system substrate-binding protein